MNRSLLAIPLVAAVLTLAACSSAVPASQPSLAAPAAATQTAPPSPAPPAPLTAAQERGLTCWQIIKRDGYANEMAAVRSAACTKVSTARLNRLLAREDQDTGAG